jgi:hypothetical protein
MAIVGITPTFMSPMAFRDSAQELAQQSREGAAALQNAFKFGTQVYDYAKNRQIGNALKEGNLDKAALLESQKINQQDPSVLWRWNQGQKMQQAQIDEAKAQRADDLKKAQSNLVNETDALLKNVTSQNPEAMAQYINNLNTQKAKLQNAGLKTDAIDAKIAEVTGNMNAAQQNIANQQEDEAFKKNSANRVALMKQYQTSESMRKYLQDHKDEMSDEDKLLAIDLIDEQRKKEKKESEARAWELHGKGQQLKNEKKQAQKDADDDWASKLF